MSLLPITQGNNQTLELVNQWRHKGKLLSPKPEVGGRPQRREAHQEGLGAAEQNMLGGLQASGSPLLTTPPALGFTQVCTNPSPGRLYPSPLPSG